MYYLSALKIILKTFLLPTEIERRGIYSPTQTKAKDNTAGSCSLHNRHDIMQTLVIFWLEAAGRLSCVNREQCKAKNLAQI